MTERESFPVARCMPSSQILADDRSRGGQGTLGQQSPSIDSRREVIELQSGSCASFGCGPVLDNLLGDVRFGMVVLGMAERLHQHAGVDPHWTRESAASVARAGLDGVVVAFPQERCRDDRASGLTQHCSAPNDALPRCRREMAARAYGLTVAALEAAIHLRLYGRNRMEMTEVPLTVLGEHDVWEENVVRIGQALDLPPQIGELGAPLMRDKGRDLTACSMLSLERSVICVDDERNHIPKKSVKALCVCLGVERRGHQEVKIARRGMAEHDTVIAMLREESLQVQCSIGECIRRKAYVFEDQRRTAEPRASYSRQETAADRPVLCGKRGILRELCLIEEG